MKLDDYENINSPQEARDAARKLLNRYARRSEEEDLSVFTLRDTDYVEYQVPGYEPIGPCHIWLWGLAGGKNKAPHVKINYKGVQVTRLVRGTPPDKYTVHICLNNMCIRRSHLGISDKKLRNSYVLIDQGLLPPNGRKKISREMCQEIRELYAGGFTQKELADHYEVNLSTISSHIHGTPPKCPHGRS